MIGRCILQRYGKPWLRLPSHHRFLKLRLASSQKQDQNETEEELDTPIKFSSSKAASWKSINTYGVNPDEEERPNSQPYIISLSTVIFLLYFCVLREENDLDEKFNKNLADHVPSGQYKSLFGK